MNSFQDKSQQGLVKKPYHRPQLQVYGALRDITTTLGNMSLMDGPSGGDMGTRVS